MAESKAPPVNKRKTARAAPSGNWNALKKQIHTSSSAEGSSRPHVRGAKKPHGALSGARTVRVASHVRRESTEAVVAGAPVRQASTTARVSASVKGEPWFAEDLSQEDMNLVMSTSDAQDHTKQKALQWEGYVDDETKRRLVLGHESTLSEEKRKLGSYVALDCEMVGCGPKGCTSVLAHVAMVNWHGHVVLDRYVAPQEPVTDYRTWVSGVKPKHLRNAPSFASVQSEVAELVKGRVLVGHAVQNDLKALMLQHPHRMVRDTTTFDALRVIGGQKNPGLRTLARRVLGIEIQRRNAPHNPVEDARATMAIYRTQKDAWDASLLGPSPALQRTASVPALRRTKAPPRANVEKRAPPPRARSALDWWVE